MTGSLRVGMVGTGEMGRPLVDRLLAAGHSVAAFARRPAARSDLEGAGVEVVSDVCELGPGRDVLVVYVYTDEQVREVVLGSGVVDGMAAGSTVLVHTTGSPRTAEAIADRASRRGVHVVDAPGSGGPHQVAAGTLTLFAGGDEAVVEGLRPFLAGYASQVVHFGPVGSGQKVKLLNNLLFGAHVQVALEAARLAELLGVDPAQLARTLHTCSGGSYALDLVAAMGSADQLVAGAGRFIHKDVVVARALAAQLGAPLGSLDDVTGPLLERISPTGAPG